MLLSSFVVSLHLLKDLNLDNDVSVCLLFAWQSSVDVYKDKLLFDLLFPVWENFYLSSFALLSYLLYLASFLSNKLLGKVVWYKNLEGLLFKELNSIIENYKELKDELLNILQDSVQGDNFFIGLNFSDVKVIAKNFKLKV